jgi:hypothetical protein
MKMFPGILLAACLAVLPGCGLIPKRVELFQDKVRTVPEMKQSDKEIQRQVAQRAEEKARETYDASVATGSDASVVLPAAETVLLTDAVSESVGPPVHPASKNDTSAELIAELRTSIANLTRRMDDFKQDNNENAGKKIEGTGLLQIPYFVWLGGFLVFAFVGFIVLTVLWSFVKMAAVANPPVQLGVSAAQLSANFLKRSLAEVLKGGEEFKSRVVQAVDDPALQARIRELFREEHMKAQSGDVQDLVKQLTRKE